MKSLTVRNAALAITLALMFHGVYERATRAKPTRTPLPPEALMPFVRVPTDSPPANPSLVKLGRTIEDVTRTDLRPTPSPRP